MFNVSIAGRLTKDAEYKKAGAYDLASFTIAVSHGRERTSFIDCQVWGKRWELIVDAYKNMGDSIQVPIIVRLQGTNADIAKALIDNSGLAVDSAVLFQEAADKVQEVLR